MSAHEVDVVVVGAGAAGLAAARALTSAGASTVVVEARDRVGGRLLNHDIGGGEVVEVGGQWVGPTQTRALQLTEELGLETFPTFDEGENVIEWRGARKRYRGAIPRINAGILLDVLRAQKRLEKLAASVPPEAPWLAPNARDLDSQTLHTWIHDNTTTAGARTLLEIGVEAVWAQEPRDVSLLHALFYVRSAGSFDDLIGTSGGAQERRWVGGSQRLALAMAAELGDRVVLSAPVRKIAHGPDGVEVRAAGGVRVKARRAIVALPPVLTSRIRYDPILPGHRDQLTQRMPQGTVWKCMAVYDEPFWRRDGLTGQSTSDVGPVRTTFDNSPPGGSPGVLLAFLEADHARRAGLVSADERRRQVVGCLTRIFGPQAARPTGYVEKSWAEEEYTRGCYGCAMTTGGWTSFGSALRAPIGPIHWAGAETAIRWSGYIDGALRSGEDAADDVLARL
jgi:monoamine oxidase